MDLTVCCLNVQKNFEILIINVRMVLCPFSSYHKESPIQKRGIRDLPMPPMTSSGTENKDAGFPDDSDDVESPSEDSDSSVNFDRFHEAWERRKKM